MLEVSLTTVIFTLLYLIPTIFLLTPPEARRLSFERPILTGLCYLGVVSAFLLVPISFRLFVVMFVFVGLFTWRLSLNAIQVIWLFFFVFIMSSLAEAAVAFGNIWLKIPNVQSAPFAISLMILIILILSWAFQKPIHHLIESSRRSSKGLKITLPIIMVSGASILSLFNLLTGTNNGIYNFQPWIYWTFSITFSLFVALGAYFADRYFKKQAEIIMLREQVSQSFSAKTAFSAFEASVEYDLMTSDFGQMLVDAYDIHERIYEGQNSQIYKLSHKDTKASHTLKAMPVSEGICSDLTPLKAIEVPGIANVLRHGKGERFTYSIKPYYEGISLSQWVHEKGALTEEEALKLTIQIKKILLRLHALTPPMVFRDVKPSNILIQPDGNVLLVDVETARKVRDESKSDTIIVGTRGYAPPEQYGFSQTGTYSDIYALGATAYFMTTGQAPSYDEVFASDQPFKGLSKAFSDYIRGCMMFDPALRRW